MTHFQKRITYQGSSDKLFAQVAAEYGFGEYQFSEEIEMGYEDYNVILTTSKGKYFVKFFASFRSKEDCSRYINIMQNVLDVGVRHPKLYQSSQGYLHEIVIDGAVVWLCVLQFIEGHSFYELNEQPNESELMFLAQQAALISQIDIKPLSVYDSWSCVNFVEEFNKKKQYLSDEDRDKVEPLAKRFAEFNLNALPHSFVHGDIIRTNVMRGQDGSIYILDFSVSNWYPRVQELAVLFCDLFFNEKDPSNFLSLFKKGLESYQEIQKLTAEERKILPIYIQVAHAMHILCPSYERAVNKNFTKENDRWLELGQQGLTFTLDLWK